MPLNGHDGEPGCKTAAEVNQVFRHNWDPTSYWQCGREGVLAQMKRCAANQLFLDEVRKCVDWKKWHWTQPQDPPSWPDNVQSHRN